MVCRKQFYKESVSTKEIISVNILLFMVNPCRRKCWIVMEVFSLNCYSTISVAIPCVVPPTHPIAFKPASVLVLVYKHLSLVIMISLLARLGEKGLEVLVFSLS